MKTNYERIEKSAELPGTGLTRNNIHTAFKFWNNKCDSQSDVMSHTECTVAPSVFSRHTVVPNKKST